MTLELGTILLAGFIMGITLGLPSIVSTLTQHLPFFLALAGLFGLIVLASPFSPEAAEFTDMVFSSPTLITQAVRDQQGQILAMGQNFQSALR